jgi:hypothetical protein
MPKRFHYPGEFKWHLQTNSSDIMNRSTIQLESRTDNASLGATVPPFIEHKFTVFHFKSSTLVDGPPSKKQRLDIRQHRERQEQRHRRHRRDRRTRPHHDAVAIERMRRARVTVRAYEERQDAEAQQRVKILAAQKHFAPCLSHANSPPDYNNWTTTSMKHWRRKIYGLPKNPST